MRYKLLQIILLIPVVLGVRIPPNPCPSIFSYFKDPRGRIYGEAVIPYDNATHMEFTVNASIVGRFKKSELTLKMVTGLHELNDYTPNVIYNIFFPFQDVIPKITGIAYNGRSYCSGPAEPVVPGTAGITNVWHKISYTFSRRHGGFYRPDPKPDQSDNDLPTKNPGERPQRPQRPELQPQKPNTQPQWPVVQPQKPSTQPWWQRPVQVPSVTPQINERPAEVPASGSDNDVPTKNPETKPNTSEFGPEKFPLDPTFISNVENLFTPPTSATPPPVPATFTSPSFTANEDFKCGISNPKNNIIPFILNSEDTDIGEYPWLVAFMARRETGYQYICSGNLISDNHVLTAARCVQYYHVQIVDTKDILLVMGTNSLTNWQSNGSIQRKVRKVQSHPSFKDNSKSADGDLAVLTMERPVQFSKVLLPVCLWKGNSDLHPFTNKTGVIAGYGQDDDAQRNGMLHAVRLKRADMPIVDQQECVTSPIGFQDLTSDKTFCTKSGEQATGPCIGDSGAGFFIKLDGAYYLRGIASAISANNGTCDLSNKYSVFCDVAKYMNWVKTAMA